VAEPLRLGVIGAGRMARRRLTAMLETRRVMLCGIAARSAESARRMADEFGGAPAFTDYPELAAARPQAVLLEVPHNVQDAAALWVVEQGWHLLLGGPLATTSAAAAALEAAADARGVIVEAGFEARYKPVWECARALIEAGRIGRITAGSGVALFPADPASWYYDEERSGGMPLTHMTYCFLNPLRWLLGEPRVAGALANRLLHTSPRHVREESCVALLNFPGDVPISLTASYVRAATHQSWNVRLFGTRAVLEIEPDEAGPGRLRVLEGEASEEHAFTADADGFDRQAAAFLETIAGGDACRNRPRDCRGDIAAVEAIRRLTSAGRTGG
jgi:predicted dehydrogenase